VLETPRRRPPISRRFAMRTLVGSACPAWIAH
jgi:hypothetical protein